MDPNPLDDAKTIEWLRVLAEVRAQLGTSDNPAVMRFLEQWRAQADQAIARTPARLRAAAKWRILP
jgi:hypothetical protein